MRVADIMRTDLVTALPETSVSEIVISLADAHISAVPVVDEHGRMLGVISASDVLEAEAEAGDATAATMVLSTTARDLMTPMVRTIVPEATLKDAALRIWRPIAKLTHLLCSALTHPSKGGRSIRESLLGQFRLPGL